MSDDTCQRTVIHKNWEGLGIYWRYTCGRKVIRTHDDNVLPMCEKHYNRWKKKHDRKARR